MGGQGVTDPSPDVREQYLRMLAAEPDEMEAVPRLTVRYRLYRLRQLVAHKLGVHSYVWQGVDPRQRCCTWCGLTR